MRFVETDDDGNHLRDVDEAFVDGYAFGGRLLEGVWFGFRISKDGTEVEAFVPSEFQSYMSRLNESEWLVRAVDFAMDTDLFATSPDADDDAVILIQE